MCSLMKIKQAEFIISAVSAAQYPDSNLPEIALAGRSNVGKSSLINKMLGRKQLARTSSSPGKTQTLNFYFINQSLYVVDLPGYGYARVSKTKRALWGTFIESYLLEREPLKLLLLLVDLRHPPSMDDQQMYQWLIYHDIPVLVVATKTDKIPKTQRVKHTKIIRERLGMIPSKPLVLFSTIERMGEELIWEIIENAVNDLPHEQIHHG